jgi:hypothetical protein
MESPKQEVVSIRLAARSAARQNPKCSDTTPRTTMRQRVASLAKLAASSKLDEERFESSSSEDQLEDVDDDDNDNEGEEGLTTSVSFLMFRDCNGICFCHVFYIRVAYRYE